MTDSIWSNSVSVAAPLTLSALQRAIDNLDSFSWQAEIEIISADEYQHRKEHNCRGGWCYFLSKTKAQERGYEVTHGW